MFKATLTVLFLAALSVAHPGHGHGVPAAARAELVPRDDTNSTSADNSTAVVSNEVLPVFVTPCVCADPLCDSRLSAKYLCQCKEAAKLACYLNSTQAGANTQGGCVKPEDDACANLS